MKRRGVTFGAADVVILLVVGVGLVAAAAYSEKIVARSDNGVDLESPPIEWRDQFYGVTAPGPEVIWMAGGGGKVIRSDDGGTRWKVQSPAATENLQDIAAWSPDRAVRWATTES